MFIFLVGYLLKSPYRVNTLHSCMVIVRNLYAYSKVHNGRVDRFEWKYLLRDVSWDCYRLAIKGRSGSLSNFGVVFVVTFYRLQAYLKASQFYPAAKKACGWRLWYVLLESVKNLNTLPQVWEIFEILQKCMCSLKYPLKNLSIITG